MAKDAGSCFAIADDDFQKLAHYKATKRSVGPWIKLSKGLRKSYLFSQLSLAESFAYIVLLQLAHTYRNRIPLSIGEIAFECGKPEITVETIRSLLEKGQLFEIQVEKKPAKIDEYYEHLEAVEQSVEPKDEPEFVPWLEGVKHAVEH